MNGSTKLRMRRKPGSFWTIVVGAIFTTFLVLVSPVSKAHAQAVTPPNNSPCTKSPLPSACYKEIRIVNNTTQTIYPVIQASIQTQAALGDCPQGGDVWLQRALADTSKCHAVNSDYYVYVNPKTGVATGQTASVLLPWWAQPDAALSKDPGVDPYIDWWRAGRIYIFDDQTALNISYSVNSGRNGKLTKFVSGSPIVSCKPNTQTDSTPKFKNVCDSSTLSVYRAQPTLQHSAIGDEPYQLNEWTFADVGAVTTGGNLTSLNLNYNVSYVDQVYLPVAMEPISATFNVGYMGTVSETKTFRTILTNFVGPSTNPNWPVYNNPIINQTTKQKKYPNAGIRLPSPLDAFNFYMYPSYIDGNLSQPTIVPLSKPFDRTKLPVYLRNIEQNWTNCTTAPYTNCPLHGWYAPIKTVFDASYAAYLKNCWGDGKGPPYMKPVSGTNPSLETYLRFVHGWVPFRVDQPSGVACTPTQVPDLPLQSQPPNVLGYAPLNYITLQYDYDNLGAKAPYLFNVYTQLIHSAGFLNASAYAFSIDDHASFQNHPGTGLIFALGGPTGLPNTNQVPPPVPPFYEWYTAGISLGAPGAGQAWKSYGVCSSTASIPFPNANPGTIGLDPRILKAPCTITLSDDRNNKYQVMVKQLNWGGSFPDQIWPKFTPTAPKPNDPNVVGCPLNDVWCKVGINETALISDPSKPNKAPTFTLGTQPPNK